MFQGLRPREVKTMRAQVTVSKALDRHSEETFGLDIQIEKSKLEKSSQPRAYRRLADTADASEEDPHVAPFNEILPISGQSHVIRPARPCLVHKRTRVTKTRWLERWLRQLPFVMPDCAFPI
jgi:hypothetical protein